MVVHLLKDAVQLVKFVTISTERTNTSGEATTEMVTGQSGTNNVI